MTGPSGAYAPCPGDRYISHALSVGMFDRCLACGFGLPEGGLIREGLPNKASLQTAQSAPSEPQP